MTGRSKTLFVRIPVIAALGVLAGALLSTGGVQAALYRFNTDGAICTNPPCSGHDGSPNSWILPNHGTCQGIGDPTTPTRPECLGTRIPISVPSSGTCGAAGGSNSTNICLAPAAYQASQAACLAGVDPNAPVRVWNPGVCAFDVNQAACTGGTNMWVDTSYCNDPRYTTSGDCTTAVAAWTTAGYCVNGDAEAACVDVNETWLPPLCLQSLLDEDRYQSVCELQLGGTWYTSGLCVGNWVQPPVEYYYPAAPTPAPTPPFQGPGTAGSTASLGTGDQCLRCHRDDIQYNGPRLRDLDDYIDTLHKGDTPESETGNGVVPCGRCHGSAVDTSTAGPPYTGLPSGSGLSTHHSTMTSPDAGSGYCTNPVFTTLATCTTPPASSSFIPGTFAVGASSFSPGVWLTACSKPGVCNIPAYTDSLSCAQNSGSWTAYGTQSACLTAGGTWNVSTCSVGGGTCAYTTAADCGTAGGTWLTNGNRCFFLSSTAVCTGGSDPGIQCATSADCTGGGTCTNPSVACAAAGLAWSNTWSDIIRCGDAGECSNVPASLSAACMAAAGTFTTSPNKCDGTGNNATLAAFQCGTRGGTWDATNVVCNNLTTSTTCSGTWTAEGKWTGTAKQQGPAIIALCTQCHRQEDGSGNPLNASNPGTVLAVGPIDNTVDFLHPANNDFAAVGNEFLNSPHGQFTGTFAQIGTGSFPTLYQSFFQREGEAANTGNSCVGCHNPHLSPTKEAEGAIHEECPECHEKNLSLMLHPNGTGTPLQDAGTDPASACEICHMPGGRHLFRINTNASYSTFPAAALTGTANANAVNNDAGFPEVALDVDLACGQCHGGGTTQLASPTTGSINMGDNVLTVADDTGFAAGERVSVAGAGPSGADLVTYIAATGPITLVGTASTSVTNATVILNPTKNGAGPLTKSQLASFAQGIHNDGPVVNFTYTLGGPCPGADCGNTLRVNVFALATCNGPCNLYEWDFGDGATGSGVTASHTYASAGPKSITLTVEQFGVGSGTKTHTVNVYTPNYGPQVDGTACNALFGTGLDSWTATLVDSSSDDAGISLVTVTWGDGSLLGTGAQGSTFTHTFRGPGPYRIIQKALDGAGQQDSRTCNVTLKYFTISGTVKKSSTVSWAAGVCTVSCATQAVCEATASADPPLGCGGTWNGTLSQCENPVGTPFPNYTFASATDCTNVSAATVTLVNTATGFVAKTAYSMSNGTFSAGSLRPGTYEVLVTQSGYTFPDESTIPAAPMIAVGPNSSGNTIQALTP
jgi:hypothetical protein